MSRSLLLSLHRRQQIHWFAGLLGYLEAVDVVCTSVQRVTVVTRNGTRRMK